MIEIMVNDERQSLSSSQMLDAVLVELGYGDQTVAVALNGEFVEKTKYPEVQVHGGDCLDVIAPMQGG